VRRDLNAGIRQGRFKRMPIELALNIVAGSVLGATHCMLEPDCEADFAEQTAAAATRPRCRCQVGRAHRDTAVAGGRDTPGGSARRNACALTAKECDYAPGRAGANATQAPISQAEGLAEI
jgi:hypothetical protein